VYEKNYGGSRNISGNLRVTAPLWNPSAPAKADLPAKPYTKAPPPPPPPPFSWSGFYVGANIGGAWARNGWRDPLFLTNFYNSNGVFIGGGQMGGNYQIGNFVIGGEWDFDWAPNNKNTRVLVPGFAATVAALPSLPFAPASTGPAPSVPSPITGINHWITTVAARFGYAVDHWLFYGKAGGGWIGNNNWTITDVTTGVSLTCGNFTNNCGNNAGWLVGAGYEYAFTNNWTVRLEYDYLFLGHRTLVIPATAPLLAGDTFTSNNGNVQMVRVGVNYLFNWGAPVAARY
jgi:outer membrane immunogenic protein